MRQLWVIADSGKGDSIIALAKKHNGANIIQFQGKDQEGEHDVVVINVANETVSDLFESLDQHDGVEITFFPHDVYPLSPPSSETPEQVTNVTHRSPMEVWLNGLQSIGSWRGFLGYAAAAAIVVWIGMYTNSSFLLVGAMMVAPFAGPAMNFSMGSATGDRTLMVRNVGRYFISLFLTILICFLLSLVMDQQVATAMMVQVSEISAVAVLLPITAGAVGALNLSQSTNSSLVPGAAVGMLVAASIAPPAGVVGMSAALGRWDMAVNGLFLLFLQLLGINLGGMIVFRAFQVGPGGARFDRGNSSAFYISLGVTVLALAGMMAIQFWSSPDFQRSTRAQRAAALVQEEVVNFANVNIVEADLRFTRPSIEEQNTLLGVVYVERRPESQFTVEQIREGLTQNLQNRLREEFNVTPLMSVTVLEE
jgi:uncharacterized hydrophobic protein (TIGR00271 family)